MADNAPDFDAMTPEELMAWMETLAKRQEADSVGFKTDANTVVTDKITPHRFAFLKRLLWVRKLTEMREKSGNSDVGLM